MTVSRPIRRLENPKKTLRSQPKHHKLGLGECKAAVFQAFAKGHFEEAEILAQQLITAYPKDVAGWKALGAIFIRLGKRPEAIPYLRKSIELVPQDAEAHFNLGVTYHQLGQLKEAEAYYIKSIELQPDNAECHNNLGNVLSCFNRLKEAEVCYLNALSINPAYANAYCSYANALLMLNRAQEAEMASRKALDLQPDFVQARVNLGAALLNQGRFGEAEVHFRQAIKLLPFEEKVHSNLGVLLLEQGRLEEARACFEHALKINPTFAECYNNLSEIKKYKENDPDIGNLEQLHQTVQNPLERMHISFALGKAYADIGKHREAFAILSEGNKLRKMLLGYSFDRDCQLFSHIYSAFESLPPVAAEFQGNPNTILIVGMPRSGTSLVEQILAAHPDVMGGGELEFLNKLAVSNLIEKDVLKGSAWSKTATIYSEQLEQLKDGKTWITDKMPHNFRWLGFLLWANPHVKVIHTVRDTMATCWSIYRQCFRVNSLGFAYDLEDLGNYYRMYEDLMAFWHEKFPGRIYDLNYERLTENQEEETRKLLEYCGLPWDDRCLEFEKTDRPVRTASAAQVRKKMYQGSSEAWRPYEPYLGPLMKALGRSA